MTSPQAPHLADSKVLPFVSLQEIEELSSFLLKNQPWNIHLLGVAGSGMSGLAGLLLSLGHHVSGSDRSTSEEVERLVKLGLQFALGHRAHDAQEADLIIYSSAIQPSNPTLRKARELKKPVARRAEVLAALLLAKKGIVISGMHGKTTTASLATHLLANAGLEPSHYIGAEIPILGTNARWNPQGDYFVAEGDESDGTLIYYSPEHAIVLNVELEHLDFYKDLPSIDAVYKTLIAQTRGKVFYWANDPGAMRVCSSHPRAIPVGTSPACFYHYEDLEEQQEGSSFTLFAGDRVLGRLELTIAGVHNVNNALLVIALALELGIDIETIAKALKSFRGAKRRFERKYQSEEVVVIDDYGHHPTEMAATLATARRFCQNGRLFLLFQPHRYSRTAAFRKEFGRVLLAADTVFITSIYPASEEPIEGISGESILQEAYSLGHPSIFYEPTLEGLRWKLWPMVQSGDLILSLGAGNIHEETTRLVADLRERDHLLSLMGSGSIDLYEPLAEHTTLRVGGPAQFWAQPQEEEGLAMLLKACTQEERPFMVMGRGSNLLVRDGGIPGVVVHLGRGCFRSLLLQGEQISVGAGVRLKELSEAARLAGLSGFEWMEGIPGNVGGALRMNAGAMGAQMFDQVLSFRYLTSEGVIKTWTPQQSPAGFEVQYRNVPFFKNNYVLSATLQGRRAATSDILECMERSRKHRRQTQPIAASAGCCFKNPRPDLSAGRLIEELGLKSKSVGKARVSPIHANFLINEGGASAEDLLQLLEEIKERAWRERGIRLEEEVQIVGVD